MKPLGIVEGRGAATSPTLSYTRAYISSPREAAMDAASKEAARSKLLITTLQKYGYDLQDPNLVEQPDAEMATMGERATVSSVGILQLREPKNNQTAFHIAVKKGHVDVLKALSKLPRAPEFINVGDRHANTALHFAASSTKDTAAEMVELLLAAGASFNAVNVRGQTPLAIHIMTAKEDTPHIARLFVRKGVPLNELINGSTYLHMAVQRGFVDMAGALVAGGASINLPDHNGAMVSDILQRKMLVKLICHMREGTQAAPLDVVRNSCKICKNPKGLLETLKDCNLCGRAVCKNCSKKAGDIKSMTADSMRDKETSNGRLCNVCCTVVLIRDKHHKEREGFNQRLFGCGMK